MKQFKNLVLSAFVLATFASTANATSANFNYGVIDLDVNTSVGAFADAFTFTLLGLSSIDYSVTKIIENFNESNGDVISIYNFQSGSAGFSYGLFDSTNNQVYNSSSLSAGVYTLKVSGIATGLYGGSYNIYANVTSIPVPEPDTSAMVLFGLSMIGLVSLRKSHIV